MFGAFARGALRCPTLLRQESVEKRAALTTSVKAKVGDNLAGKEARLMMTRLSDCAQTLSVGCKYDPEMASAITNIARL
jgi:hypothetical protein